VLSWSCQRLDQDAARAFGLLGHHPGPDFDGYAAAALTGTTHAGACLLLDQLASAYLIQPAAQGRYGMHDLLRAYARDRNASDEPRRAALSRLFDYYLLTASAAADTLFAARWQEPRRPPSGARAPLTGSQQSARAWLDAELGNLLAAIAVMADDGWPGQAVRLAAAVFPYLESFGRTCEAISAQRQAIRASRVADDNAGQAAALGNLGYIFLMQGRYQPAASHFQRAITLFRETGDRKGEATALGNLAVIDRRLGRYEQAARRQLQALVLYRQVGDQWGEALTLTRLGGVHRRLGHFCEAENHLRQALALSRLAGDPTGEAEALTRLGVVELDLGRARQALDHHQRAAALFRHNKAPRGEAEALNGLGEAYLALGRPQETLRHHAAACELTEQAGGLNERARAHHGLAKAHQAVGSQEQARCHFGTAMNLYAQLGAPEAEQIRVQLLG